MSVQSTAQVSFGLAAEPPVSPPPAEDGPELRAAPTPAEVPAPLRPPLEAQLVQAGKLSMGQLAQAHRDRLENGGSVLDIVVERGWVSAEEVAALRAERGVDTPAATPVVQPAAAPVVAAAAQATPAFQAASEGTTEIEQAQSAGPAQSAEPAGGAGSAEGVPPVPEAQPSATLQHSRTTPDTAKSGAQRFTVAIRLTNGELIAAGQADGRDMAEALGQAVVADLATVQGDAWPYFDGRYLRPDTIVSVDLVAEDS